MKIVLDTNVLIAAFASQGLCHSIFELCLYQYQIILSDSILTEVATNLERKLHVPAGVIQETIQYLRINTLVEKVQPPTSTICRDPSEDWVIALAEQAKADFIVTGDQDLLILNKLGNIFIIPPRRMWEILNKS